MEVPGYFRHPSIYKNSIAFVCEDDIWAVSTEGGAARRLTVGKGDCLMPRYSPDGKWIAFAGREEGPLEIYVIPADGGHSRRLTYLSGDSCILSGWTPDSSEILFATDAGTPFVRHTEVYAVSVKGGAPRPLNLGQVKSISFSKDDGVAIARNAVDPAMWKRYRGGTAGEIWVDASGKGKFKRILTDPGNYVWPMWIGQRLYYLSDSDGVGNIYSCRADGTDIRCHTRHTDFFVRYPSTDGRRIVYTAGGDIFVHDVKTDRSERVSIHCPATTSQSSRRFVGARYELEHLAVNPQGHSLALIARGQPATMPFWEEAPVQHGEGSSVRYRLCEWLPDGRRFVVVTDKAGFEQVELHREDQTAAPAAVSSGDIGRLIELEPSPVEDRVAFSNHRYELCLLDLKTKKTKVLDKSPADRITGLSWSPDGRWLAYCWAPHHNSWKVRVVEASTGKVHDMTDGLRCDYSPCWDPAGKYLYFLSTRDFYPVYDHMSFDLSFVESGRPFLVTLRKDVPSPFVPQPKSVIPGSVAVNVTTSGAQPNTNKPGNKVANKKKSAARSASGRGDVAAKKMSSDAGWQVPTAHLPVEIDFDGIEGRILGFPVEPGRYGQIVAAHNRALFTRYSVKGIKPGSAWWKEEEEFATLMAYDFEENRSVSYLRDVARITLAADHRTLVYTSRDRSLRVVDAAEKLPDNGPATPPAGGYGRKTGWIDLARVNVMVTPGQEWSQMFNEAWRLQREQFWDERMSDVDWELVRRRYSALLPRLRTRGELSDLIWEMQGELGTSHAYEMLGDYRAVPPFYRGFLGADLSYDKKSGGYRIDTIYRGDSWEPDADSPLAQPGLGIACGDIILSVGGYKVSRQCSVEELLLHTSGLEVVLVVCGPAGKPRRVVVKTLREERLLRYRHWVESNRQYVHKQTEGRVGYLHIPDMGPFGFAEFHRGYLSEFNRQGLIVDVRYNRGGHVSPLLLEKLARKRVGYDVSRWGMPQPYPPESVAGPIVGITNQFAGSDGDIFSHCFKLYKLGPLVGKRTWGGVIGIWPRHKLVDGTITTQPEFSFWFEDVGWQVENYGTQPDYEVDIAPHDYASGRDPQLDRALELVREELAIKPVNLPEFKQRPSLKLPRLAKRSP